MLRTTYFQPSKVNKIFVLGAKGCGKTSIIDQLIYGTKQDYMLPKKRDNTIEDIYPAVVIDDRGKKERIHFYDTAGINVTKKFDFETLKNYITYADAVVLVYSIDNKDSFNVVNQLKKVIDKFKEKKEIPMICLGNKVDCFDNRKVEFALSLTWAQKENIKLFEVSATEKRTLLEPFLHLSSKLGHPQNKFVQLGKRSKDSNITIEL